MRELSPDGIFLSGESEKYDPGENTTFLGPGHGSVLEDDQPRLDPPGPRGRQSQLHSTHYTEMCDSSDSLQTESYV